jgi:hypothetical protein
MDVSYAFRFGSLLSAGLTAKYLRMLTEGPVAAQPEDFATSWVGYDTSVYLSRNPEQRQAHVRESQLRIQPYLRSGLPTMAYS